MTFIEVLNNIILFITLFALECALGIDNLIAISIFLNKAPKDAQHRLRITALSLGLILRVGLVMAAVQLYTIDRPILASFGFATPPKQLAWISYRDSLLISGGLFLIYNAVTEIIHFMEVPPAQKLRNDYGQISRILFQLVLIDIVFSVDSILTSIALTQNLWLIAGALLSSFMVVIAFSHRLIQFINQHPSIKMLALAFLLALGLMLLIEGFHIKIPKILIYGPIGIALLIEFYQLFKHRSYS